MRIPSGVTDQYIYFVAVDSTDLKTRETGLTTFTVYRSRNGGAAAAYTTPTINETDATNMPGLYELLVDEEMTIDAGDDEQEFVLHITHAGMAPVTRAVTLYRSKATAGETVGVSGGAVSNVTTVATTTTNTDMRGTDGANTTTPPTVAQMDARTLLAADYFDPANDDVAVVTSNADMRGTDSALLASTFTTMFSGITSLAQWLGLIAGKQVGDTTARNEIRATGAGSGTFDETADSLEAIRDEGSANWLTGAGGSAPTVGEIADAVLDEAMAGHTTAGTLGKAVSDIPTTAMRGTDNAATEAKQDVIDSLLDALTIAVAAIPTTAMRGTDSAATEAKQDTIDGLIDALTIAVAAIPTTPMRGTDGANTATPPTSAAIAAAILAAGDVDGYSVEETLKLCLSALAAKLSGAATATVTIRAADDSKDRITATVDSDGNRSAVTLDAAG